MNKATRVLVTILIATTAYIGGGFLGSVINDDPTHAAPATACVDCLPNITGGTGGGTGAGPVSGPGAGGAGAGSGAGPLAP